MKKLILGFFAVVSLVGVAAHGFEFAAGDMVSVSGGKADYYVAWSSVSLANPIEGDLWAASNMMTLDKTISNDAVIVGNIVAINAPIGDDLKVAASQVTLNANVAGDVFIFGSNVVIGKDVVIGWDVIIWGANVIINGTIKGNARVYGANVTVAGTIGKDARRYAEKTEIVSGAKIVGNLTYTSKEQNPALEAIAGSATYKVDEMGKQRDEKKQFLTNNKEGILATIIAAVLAFKFISLSLVSLLLWFAFRPWYGRAAQIVKSQPWASFGVGAATLLFLPLVALVLLFTGVLSALGGLLLAGWIFMLLFIEVALVLVVTGWLRNRYNKRNLVWKEVLWIIVLAFACSLISGVDTLFGIFAIGALTILKWEMWNKLKTYIWS